MTFWGILNNDMVIDENAWDGKVYRGCYSNNGIMTSFSMQIIYFSVFQMRHLKDSDLFPGRNMRFSRNLESYFNFFILSISIFVLFQGNAFLENIFLISTHLLFICSKYNIYLMFICNFYLSLLPLNGHFILKK